MITDRRNKLLGFLMNNDDVYISQYEISQQLPLVYFYDGSEEDFHDSKTRQLITSDIRAINSDLCIEAVILSNGKGVKLATKEEFEQSMRAEFAAIFRRLKRAYAKAKKGAINGQYVIEGDMNIKEYNIFRDIINEKYGEEKQK